MNSKDFDLAEEYKAMLNKYEPIFGKYDKHRRMHIPIPQRIKEMSDKLDEYYRQQAQKTEKRKPELATA